MWTLIGGGMGIQPGARGPVTTVGVTDRPCGPPFAPATIGYVPVDPISSGLPGSRDIVSSSEVATSGAGCQVETSVQPADSDPSPPFSVSVRFVGVRRASWKGVRQR